MATPAAAALRFSSVKELAEHADAVPVDDKVPLERYYRSSLQVLREARMAQSDGTACSATPFRYADVETERARGCFRSAAAAAACAYACRCAGRPGQTPRTDVRSRRH